MSRCLLLLNRASGANERGLDGSEVCQLVESIFREAGHEISSVHIEPDGLEPALEQAVKSRPDVLLIAGGDGTVSAAARFLGGTDIVMGILPMGTFNLAARDLGVPLDVEEAARFLSTAEACSIDVMDVSGHACLCTTIFGFYPEFSNIFEKRDHGGHWWRKSIKLMLGMRTTFMQAQPLKLAWESDQGSGLARTRFSAFVPGRYQNSAGLIPVRTGFRSGTLSAYISTHRSPSSALRGILDYSLGRQEENPELRTINSSRIILRASRRKGCRVMLDGEILRLAFPIELRILPGHLNVLAAPENLSDATVETE